MLRHRETRLALGVVVAIAALTAARAMAAAPTPRPVSPDGVALARAVPLPLVALDATAWVPGPAQDQVIDDFESATWPDPTIWPAVLDLTSASGSPVTWAPRDCRAAGGGRSLWAIGGGAGGAVNVCGSAFADGQASSALLALDLTSLRSAADLWLVYDLWADAAPSEGLFINVLEPDQVGDPAVRRIVYSATGRSTAWARGIRLDLTHLRDRTSGWTLDARGQSIVLEFLFIGLTGLPDGEGMYVDNLSLSSREAPPIIVTSTPAPDNTIGCTGGPDCGSLSVRAYVDSGCDGRFQPGIDTMVRSQPRVDVTAGSVKLGTLLSTNGAAFFRLPISSGAVVQLAVPEGYEMCPNSPNPHTIDAHHFRPFGRAKHDMRLKRPR